MRRALSGERGLAGWVLVIVIVWALAAVLMLTGTIRAAQTIDETVLGRINPEVGGIDQDLDNVRELEKTERISQRILGAARPLNGRLVDTVKAAKAIDVKAERVLDTARSINDVVLAINENARAINGNVTGIHRTAGEINTNARAINGNVRSIQSRATAIRGNVFSIGRTADSIGSSARSINASVRSIHSNAGRILTVAGSIDKGVEQINTNAETIRGEVVGEGNIRANLRDVLRGVEGIEAHARSICNSPLVNGGC